MPITASQRSCRARVARIARGEPSSRKEAGAKNMAAKRAGGFAGRFLFTGHDPAATPPVELFLGPVWFPPAIPAAPEPLLVAPAAG